MNPGPMKLLGFSQKLFMTGRLIAATRMPDMYRNFTAQFDWAMFYNAEMTIVSHIYCRVYSPPFLELKPTTRLRISPSSIAGVLNLLSKCNACPSADCRWIEYRLSGE